MKNLKKIAPYLITIFFTALTVGLTACSKSNTNGGGGGGNNNGGGGGGTSAEAGTKTSGSDMVLVYEKNDGEVPLTTTSRKVRETTDQIFSVSLCVSLW